MVRFVNIRQLKAKASEMLRASRKCDIIVTSRGKPQAVLHAVDEEELEDYLLAHSPKFLKGLESSYREYQRKGGSSISELLEETEKEIARLQR